MFDLSLGGIVSWLGDTVPFVGVILLVYGLVNALFGYKLFKIVLAIVGFLTGAVIGAVVSLFLLEDSTGAVILCTLLGGILGAVLAVVLHRLGVFISVGAMGFCVFYVATQVWFVALVIGIVCGIIAVFLEKYAVIVSTSLSGGAIAGIGAGVLARLDSTGVILVTGLLIGICGIAVQLAMERRKPAAAAVAAAAAASSVPPSWPQGPSSYAPPSGRPPAAAADLYCPNCGRQLTRGASFCRNCGRAVPPESPGGGACSVCGAALPNSANFCRKCGAAR